jgi:hypothetical protein
MASFQRLHPGFSTADTSYPSLHFDNNRLTVEFDDWQERPVIVVFENAVAVRWEEGDSLLGDHRDDECYQVEESPWLEKMQPELVQHAEKEFRHFRLCFNTYGVLDVIASCISHQ